MSTDEMSRVGGGLPGGIGTVPRPADTEAARRLGTRVLVLASAEAEATAPYVDPTVSGLIVTGANAHRTVRTLRRQYPDLMMLVEPTSTAVWATKEAPFVLETSGLFEEKLGDVLDAQLQVGASVAVTPTAVFQAGDSEAMKAALKQANDLDRDDFVFLLPVHYRWLDESNIKQLIAIVTRSRHPVAIALADSSANPLAHKGAIPSYRRLFEAAPWAMPWRADLAAFDALAHGARAAAIGQLPSLRRLAFPDKGGFSSDKSDMSPHVLLANLLRYRRSSKMQQEWYASAQADTCSCQHCGGRDIDRFNGSDEQRLQAHLHNLHETTTMRREIDGLTTEQIAAWWKRRLLDVEYERQALKGRIGADVKTTPDVEEWLRQP
ncbi:MAG: hypothetical protein PGN24_06715 [Microbacterium arborescens]